VDSLTHDNHNLNSSQHGTANILPAAIEITTRLEQRKPSAVPYVCPMSPHIAVFLIGIVVMAGSVVGIAFSERVTHLQKPTSDKNWYLLTQGRVVSAFVVALAGGLLLTLAAFLR
jgi:hypothetical protein